MTRTKTILPVLIAVIIASTIGAVSAVDPVTNDGKNTSFIMTFSAFNATDSSSSSPISGDIRTFNYKTIYYEEFDRSNTPSSRTTLLSFIDENTVFDARLVDGKTDGVNFEFTWLVNHSTENNAATSMIVVNGQCDASTGVTPGNGGAPLTFTTTKGDLVITANTVPSLRDGTYSQYSAVCETPRG